MKINGKHNITFMLALIPWILTFMGMCIYMNISTLYYVRMHKFDIYEVDIFIFVRDYLIRINMLRFLKK